MYMCITLMAEECTHVTYLWRKHLHQINSITSHVIENLHKISRYEWNEMHILYEWHELIL